MKKNCKKQIKKNLELNKYLKEKASILNGIIMTILLIVEFIKMVSLYKK